MMKLPARNRREPKCSCATDAAKYVLAVESVASVIKQAGHCVLFEPFGNDHHGTPVREENGVLANTLEINERVTG
jgi:hypothetical protein